MHSFNKLTTFNILPRKIHIMEKFSNNREEYWNQIKKELLGIGHSGNFRFQYLEIGLLFSHGFSIILSEKVPQELVLKIWNAKYDNKRFDKGIFNLDRLAIINKKIKLNSRELETVNRLLNSKLELTDSKGIALDGLFCQFETNLVKLNWNINEEINNNLIELVTLLRHKSSV